MRRRILTVSILAICCCFTAIYAQRGFMPFAYNDRPAPLPPDAGEKTGPPDGDTGAEKPGWRRRGIGPRSIPDFRGCCPQASPGHR